MTDVPGTSPERPIIWSPGRPATGSRRRPVDVPIQNFCIFVFPVKNSNKCVTQELLHLKNTFFIKLPIFCWCPKSPLKVPWRSWTLGPLGYLQGTSPGRRVPTGKRSFQFKLFFLAEIIPLSGSHCFYWKPFLLVKACPVLKTLPAVAAILLSENHFQWEPLLFVGTADRSGSHFLQ